MNRNTVKYYAIFMGGLGSLTTALAITVILWALAVASVLIKSHQIASPSPAALALAYGGFPLIFSIILVMGRWMDYLEKNDPDTKSNHT